MMSLTRPIFGVARSSGFSACQTSQRSSSLTWGSTRFWICVTRISPKEYRPARSATASICSAEASPGMPPIGLSEITTET
jgi:hypothetical protein